MLDSTLSRHTQNQGDHPQMQLETVIVWDLNTHLTTQSRAATVPMLTDGATS